MFLQENEESIYGKLFKNNMDGLSSFYPFTEGIDYLVNSDTEVALFHFQDINYINSFEKYRCKVKTSKKLRFNGDNGVHILILFHAFSETDNNSMEGSNDVIYYLHVYEKKISIYKIHFTQNHPTGRNWSCQKSIKKACYFWV